MNVCLIGKYPPIEGGVSAQTYWLARGLAARGHQVHVVTNADEVEDRYRLTLGAEDADWYQPRFEHGGRVGVYNAEPFTRHGMGHIPVANPFVTKLASLATDVIRQYDCDVILAYYFEPYVVAGWLASQWTDRPLVTKHAGSDLDRLCRVPDLATSYKEILRSASAVVTQPRLMPRFLGMGVDRSRLERDVPYWLPSEVFRPQGDALDVDRLSMSLADEDDPPSASRDEGAPVVGILGKIGITKGTFDLITALGHLKREGVPFRFAAMVGREQGQDLREALHEADIVDRTRLLPMLPNWRVPAFIRACTAVCFLEREFPIAIHGPVIPREVLACGTCLILSKEIANKQRYRERLVTGHNMLEVGDPKDHAELTASLRQVLHDPSGARAIGGRGVEVSRAIEGHDDHAAGWEALLQRHVGRAASPSAGSVPDPLYGDSGWSFEWVMPDLMAFLRRVFPAVVAAYSGDSPCGSAFDTAIRFCEFAAREIPKQSAAPESAKVVAALSYARERLMACYEPPGHGAPVFSATDRLRGTAVSMQSAGLLRPVRGSSVRVVAFDYDLSGIGILATIGGHASSGDDGADLARLERAPIVVLFHRSANLIPCELRIDEPTRELVRLCDGTRTTCDVAEAMCRYFGADAAERREEVGERVAGALDRLYRAGVLVFGEHRGAWGWTGGARGAAH